MNLPNPVSSNDPIRVLLVEDNPGDVFLLEQLLIGAPVVFEVVSVTTLAEAAERLSQEMFHVVLADLTLPDSAGLATFQALYDHPSRVPIVVLSGLLDEAMALKTVEMGAQDYLVKGHVDQALLVRTLRYAIKRAEADKALAEERNLLRSVIDNLVDAIYVKDAHGRYLLGNAAHARQLGMARTEEIVGKSTGDFFPADLARQFREDDERVMTTGEPIINRHECIKDGQHPVRWLSTTKVPLRDGGGAIIGIVGIGRDITSRKLAEQQVAEYTRELKEKNAELEGDLEMAREVQQAFLPQQFPTFPRHATPARSALRFYSRYLPTTTLGGDFFHVLPISDTEAGVLICDVMGHGVRAALVTAIQRALVEELTQYASVPGEFLTQMNAAFLSILRRTRSPMFASAFYLVVDLAKGMMRYANAGHPRPLHIRRGAGEIVCLEGPGPKPGPALGVFESSQYLQQECTFAPRDVVLLFTDGLFEVENARGEFYDQKNLLEAIRKRLYEPVDQILESTLEEVRNFSVTHGFIDDVCLVGVEIVGAERS